VALEKMKTLKPAALLVLLGILWGSGYTLARFAVLHGVSPLGYAFWQTAGPSVLLLIYLIMRSQLMRIQWQHGVYFLFIGLLGVALPNTNMYFASRHVPSGMLSVVINTSPVFVYLIALWAGEEKWSPVRVLALVLLIVGLGMIVLPGWNWYGNGNLAVSPRWVLLALASPLCFASAAVFIAQKPVGLSVGVLACGMMMSAWFWLCPVVWVTHSFYWPASHWHARDTAVLAEIVLSSLGYVVFFELLLSAGAVYYSFVSGVVAMMGVIWGKIFFTEPLSLMDSLAMLVIFIATMIIVLVRRNNTENSLSVNG